MGEQAPRGTLYVVVCAAPPAAHVQDLVKLAQAAGWEVAVTATPEALAFIDAPLLEAITGFPVRHRWREPDEPESVPEANAIVVAPATFNTINRWVAGITNTVAVGTLCESLGSHAPVGGDPRGSQPGARGYRVATPTNSGDRHRGEGRWRGAVTQPVEYMSVGERIAIYRRRRGLSQLALANMIGRSEAWLSQVERGIRHVDRVSVLIRLAQVLKVSVEDLIGQPLSLAPNGGIEFRAIPALRAALTDYELIPATFGVATGDGPTRDLPSLRRNVDQANRLYQAAHYEEAGLLCSRLIGEAQRATRELTGDDRRDAFGVLAETYHITSKTLTKVGEAELAWVAAERSLPAAQSAELPLLLAASAYHLGHVFLRAGQVEEATSVAMTAARALEPGLATANPEHLSAWGALHLTALIAVARQDDRVAVRQLLGEAWTTADRLGQERNDFWTAFGPTNVALHEVSTAVELGDPGEVVRKGEALDPARFPPGLLGRRAQVFIDLARGYTQQRKDAAAVNMLLEAERLAPEAVRYQVIVKEMLRELLRREHRASTPQLRPLAVRVGILREDAS